MSKKESYWFSHDSNASTNPKLLALIRKYGYEGYGRWWRVLERLRDCDEYKYDISVPFAWEVLGQDLMMEPQDAEAFVRDCIDYYQLLETDGKKFWSESMLDRMEYWEKRREVLRERGRRGAEVTNAKKKKQKEQRLSDGTSEEELRHKTANDTKQNDTKRNETKPNDDEADIINNEEVFTETNSSTELEQLRNRALNDGQRFVLPYVSTGKLNKEQLGDWLTAFNTWLEFTGEDVKTERDYRRHFASWFRYRDVLKEDPRKYNPAGATVQHATATSAPPPPQEPTVKREKTMPLPVLRHNIPKEQPKGKYSKGNNKYDMHWLKNLRDEVRSMGG